MRPLLLLLVLTPALAAAQGTARGGRAAIPITIAAAPQQIVAPEVPVLPGLPHAVRVGFTVYVSAMVPVDSAGRLVGEDLATQTHQVLKNLSAVLRAARGVPGDVVRATIYLRDLSPDAVASVRTALLGAVDPNSPPALTIVGVSAFPEATMRVMIDATAQLRGEYPDRSRDTGRP